MFSKGDKSRLHIDRLHVRANTEIGHPVFYLYNLATHERDQAFRDDFEPRGIVNVIADFSKLDHSICENFVEQDDSLPHGLIVIEATP